MQKISIEKVEINAFCVVFSVCAENSRRECGRTVSLVFLLYCCEKHFQYLHNLEHDIMIFKASNWSKAFT